MSLTEFCTDWAEFREAHNYCDFFVFTNVSENGDHFPANLWKTNIFHSNYEPHGNLHRIHWIQRIRRKCNIWSRTDPGFPTPGARMTVVYTNSLKLWLLGWTAKNLKLFAEPLALGVSDPRHHPNNEWNNKSMKQWINQTVNQSINQSIISRFFVLGPRLIDLDCYLVHRARISGGARGISERRS